MVAMVGNRALDDPGAFGVEHNDALAVRDLGWQLIWVDSAQEALDTALIAYRVAEDRRVFLPCAISCDGAFLTHSQALVKIPSQEKVNAFLPRYNRGDLQLHPDNPITVAPQVNEDWLMEIRRQNAAAMERTLTTVIPEAYAEFNRIFGRNYENPFFEEYQTQDADVVLIGMGTLSTPVKVAIRQMRQEGKKVGFVRVRWFRPFAAQRLAALLGRFRAVGVIDRDFSLGSPYLSGVLATEVRAAMYGGTKQPPILGFICGLGGREVTVPGVRRMTEAVYQAADGKPQPATQWIGLRE
jgi:pyruvate ferredoxin oxidoreductase alpha subunit